MKKDVLSSVAFLSIAEEATKKGSTTHKGEQRHREGKGLHELVDPKGFGAIRRSLNRMVELSEKKLWQLVMGVAMLIELRFDTTGSMGDNVEKAFNSLLRSYDLLRKVLNRYDLQIINSIFGDVVDNYILCRSQAEMAEKIADQLTMMVPEGGGGDSDEDPQYGIFGAAYLTNAAINNYGLKSYDFTVTDARGRDRVSIDGLKRVFGDNVLEKVKENGFQIKENDLPDLKQMMSDLQKRAHAFAIIIGSDVGNWWEKYYSKERVVKLPTTDLLPEMQAAIVGLTEGTLTLKTLEEFLIEEAKLSATDAKMILRAVSGIPIGAQASLENFNKIPLEGAVFKNKTDIWPVGVEEEVLVEAKEDTKKKAWL